MKEIDPIKYEIFKHRLTSILEEGRIAMRMVSGSPVTSEGGETCAAFFTAEGATICTSTGVIPHAVGSKEAVLYAIKEFGEDPGFVDGDQMFMNNPYIAGLHTCDQMVIKPIYYQGGLIAWVSSIIHTGETGALEPGGMPNTATEIFHEGICIAGLKVVEAGKFRKDVFESLTGQVRDKAMVGLDLKARIASNNVAANRLLEVVETFGLDFFERASRKLIQDTETKVRALLRELPDGTWRSRMYGDSAALGEERPVKVMCTMTKAGEHLTFDFTGTSPQTKSPYNLTRHAAFAFLFTALGTALLWDMPVNDGVLAPMDFIFPEGSVLNAKYPAAISNGVSTYGIAGIAVLQDCLTKMLYAAGKLEDVTAGWRAFAGGLLYFDGTDQRGGQVASMLMESFAAGCGATPTRQGVDAGGQALSAVIADAEAIEYRLPFMYLGRYIVPDSGGFGKFRGGNAVAMIYRVYGSDDFRVGRRSIGRRTVSSLGMFGGYPGAPQPGRVVFDSDIREWAKRSKYPVTFEQVGELKGDRIDDPRTFIPKLVDDRAVIVNILGAGGGYGDPLDADPKMVEKDVKNGLVSATKAEEIYGVILNPNTLEVTPKKTEAKRESIRRQRIREGRKVT